MSTSKVQRGDALWPWYLVTIFYLSVGMLVLYDRWGEIGSLLVPPAEPPARLPLNSIGDILAGFFAPLAFLWLFVATTLQRKELRLQREELAETRRVLDEQKEEMQRSAQESNLQTAIMQKTLDATRSKIVYDDFNLKLYFLSKIFLKANGLEIIAFPEKNPFGVSKPIVRYSGDISQNNPTSIDNFFESLSENLISVTIVGRSGAKIHAPKENAHKLLIVFGSARNELRKLLNFDGVENNDLIINRIEGLYLLETLASLDMLEKLIEIDKTEMIADF